MYTVSKNDDDKLRIEIKEINFHTEKVMSHSRKTVSCIETAKIRVRRGGMV